MTPYKAGYLEKQFAAHWEFVERLTLGRFKDENLAHEALLYVSEKIEEDGWRRLKAFKGNSRFKTFLGVVVRRLMDDFSRQKFGRIRPPEWVKAQGGLWLDVFRMLCLERMEPGDVVEIFDTREGNRAGRDVRGVEEAVAVILSRITDCGKNSPEPMVSDPLEIETHETVHPALHTLGPDDYFQACERITLTELISRVVTGVESFPVKSDLKGPILDFRKQIKLSPEETVFLKTIYQEGFSVSEAGRMLGWGTHQASGKHRRLMERTRSALQASGLLEKVKEFIL